MATSGGATEATGRAWLHDQWSNPGDIFTLLMILGGDVVQVAIAQLSAGPIPCLTPVCFSFGWVSYAVSAVLAAVGSQRLMPKPEIDCILINADSGYARANFSWVLGRVVRDFRSWCGRECLRIEDDFLKASGAPRVGLRVSIWQTRGGKSDGRRWRSRGDALYWSGFMVMFVQLGIAAAQWCIYGE